VTAREPLRCKSREASLITGLDIRTLQEKAANGQIPGARKVFGRWTYDIAKLRRLGVEGRSCEGSTRETGYSGRVSRSAAMSIESAYELVLARLRSGG
jgi:hypothetical protein